MNKVNITGNQQQQVSVSATASQSSVLVGGMYDIWSNVDVYIKTGVIGTDVTTDNGYLLRVGETVAGVVVQDGDVIGAISASSGTLSYHKVN